MDGERWANRGKEGGVMIQFQHGAVMTYNNGRMVLTLHNPQPGHCDCCAGDLPRAYVDGLLYGQHVQVCSGMCLSRLRDVWAPSRRRLAVTPLVIRLWALVVLGMSVMALWH